jgi:hypothetical protein
MRARDNHIPIDRLTALSLGARGLDAEAADAQDQRALAHLAGCARCSDELGRLTAQADELRDLAFAEADDVFDDAMLDAQRTRILDRLAHLGQAARVLSFPRRSREVVMPVSGHSRRWVSVAAAAGLIIGLVAGQMLHFIPAATNQARDQLPTIQGVDRPGGGPALIPATSTSPMLSDDELMDAVETAVQVRRAQSLQALDALTPTAADLIAMGR